MPPRRITVFFYGLFMDPEALSAKGLHPSDPKPACLPGFRLRIGQRATLVPDPDTAVYGFTMQLTQEEITLLYADPSVSAYRPEAVLVQFTDHSTAAALCFNLVTPPDPTETNAQYATQLRDLATRLGLPAHYVTKIR